MSYNKNVVEDALFQIKNLEETLQENAKGILQSTMSEEIKQLVKESLREQDEDEIEEPTPDDDDMAMDDDEMSMDDDDMAMDDDDMAMDDDDMAMDDDDMAMDDDDMAMDDDETIDMTGASDAEVLKVFKAMGDEDGIIVKKDGENIHLTDGEDEYMIQLGESDIEGYDIDAEEYTDEFGENMAYDSDLMYEIEVDDNDDLYEDMYMDNVEDDLNEDMYMDDNEDEVVYEIAMDDQDNDDMGDLYMEEDDDDMMSNFPMDEDDDSDYDLDAVMEAVKKSMKPKGVGIGKGPKFSYDKRPNMDRGFDTKKKEAFGKGTKAMGTGKAKFEYKEEDLHAKMKAKKMETKEAVRTNSYTRANKVGNRKGSDQNINRKEIRQRPNTRVNEQVEMLREKNEEYKKALDVFRTKLNEVAIFNSNLAYATRLFTEHSTTKQEKINILRRFDNVESLKESKNLYRTIKSELNTGSSSSEQKINESIERTVNKTVESGSAVNLIESKTYENPQFLRMKDLMGKIK